jgi:methylated-DNA-[protein]-cysteine S-methyltransferase
MSDGIEMTLRRGLAGGDPAAAARRVTERALAEGLVDVAYATVDSPLGPLMVAGTPRGLVRLAYGDEERVLDELADRISPRVLEAPGRMDAVRRQLDEYFEGRRRRFDVPVDWSLTTAAFARRVLERTAAVPFGGTISYREAAEAAGSPRGARAAGNALGQNRIPIVVPCHRVLHSGGGLGGYTGGLHRKEYLLHLEGALAR